MAFFSWFNRPGRPVEIPEFQIGHFALGPNDIVVIKAKDRLSAENFHQIREAAYSVIGLERKVLVLDEGLDLSVLTRAEIEARS